MALAGMAAVAVLTELGFRAAYRSRGADRDKIAFRAGFARPSFSLGSGLDGRRYKPSDAMRGAGFRDSSFLRDKEPGSVRIAFFGESAVWGANYVEPLSFPNGVKVVLDAVAPWAKAETINCALPGISTFRVTEMARAMTGYDVDVYVVYTGNNEFFQTQPVLEVQLNDLLSRLAERSAIYHGWLRWRHSRAVRLAEKYERHYRDAGAPAVPAALFGYFEHRLREIVRICRSKAITPVLCTLVVNEKDWPAWGEESFDRTLSPEEERRWAAIVSEADALVSAGSLRAAAEKYAAAGEIALYSSVQFRYGHCLRKLGRFREALDQFEKANLLSQSRAKRQMNDIVKDVARQEDVPLCDVVQAFRERAADGLIGYRLDGRDVLDDDVHFAPYGQYLAALEICRTLDRAGLLGGRRAEWERTPTFAEYSEKLSLSARDLKNSYLTIADVVIPRNIDRGLEFVRRARRIDPGDPRGYLYEGLAAALQKRSAAAREAIGRAIALDPGAADHISPVHRAFLEREGYLAKKS